MNPKTTQSLWNFFQEAHQTMAEQSFDSNGLGEVAQTAPSSDSKASQKNYNPTTAIIRTQIEEWLQDNTYASLSIVSITPYPESCITFEIKPKYLTNAKKHQFQVFCNDKWRPLVGYLAIVLWFLTVLSVYDIR